jgi:hypothetical protein
MHHWLLIMVMNLKGPTPTPILHKQVYAPPIPSPDIFSIIYGSGLTFALLVLVLLILLGVLAWIVWMFITGRWITAQHVAAQASRAPLQNDRPRSTTNMEGRSFADQSWMPESYSRPPVQTAPPNAAVQQRSSISKEPPPAAEDPLDNKRWLGLVKGCVDLFDELDGLFPDTDSRQEAAHHVMHRLREILSRSGVEIISRDRTYDVYRHRLEPPGTTAAPGTPIIKIISPGFAIGRVVLRPARVQVATSPVENVERE